MLACKYNTRGSEFIREEAGTSAACASPGVPPSRMNSVPPDGEKPVGAGLGGDKAGRS